MHPLYYKILVQKMESENEMVEKYGQFESGKRLTGKSINRIRSFKKDILTCVL